MRWRWVCRQGTERVEKLPGGLPGTCGALHEQPCDAPKRAGRVQARHLQERRAQEIPTTNQEGQSTDCRLLRTHTDPACKATVQPQRLLKCSLLEASSRPPAQNPVLGILYREGKQAGAIVLRCLPAAGCQPRAWLCCTLEATGERLGP